MENAVAIPDAEAVRAAYDRIAPWIHRTPVITSRSLDQLSGAQLFFKCEHLQKTGAFKARGASNAVLGLDASVAASGVATHSSGNHGAALAWAARLRGIPAHIVVPANASAAKCRNIERYGARIVRSEPTQIGRETRLRELLEETGAHAVPPYDDARVICGQGTAALELLEDIPDLAVLITPVGGGGLLSGSAIVAKSRRPALRVIGAEPAGAADAQASFRAGVLVPVTNPQTVADGLRATLGVLNFALLRQHVDAILSVDDAGIIAAMRLFWDIAKQLIEPSSATVLAAVLAYPELFHGRRVGLILSGGNIDIDQLPWSDVQGCTNAAGAWMRRSGDAGQDST